MEWVTWWAGLCAAATANAAAWIVSARSFPRLEASLSSDVYRIRRQLLLLSAVYVLGCGFRSVLPMVDVPRICLHDTWISRIAVGRSVATVAELAFAMQWALVLREMSGTRRGGLARIAAKIIVPVIIAAEAFSWSAVLTRNNLLHAVENSLWTLDAALGLAAFLALRPHVSGRARRFLEACIAGAAAYISFMATVDVPMYLSRWREDFAQGVEYLSAGAGLRELLARCIVNQDWAAWREDALWLTLYFTLAVWISIGLAHAPALRRSIEVMKR